MEIKELKEKSAEELNALLKSWRETARGLRFSAYAKQLKNIRELRNARKLIARILTVLKEKSGQSL